MHKEFICLAFMFLICNKFYDRPELLFISYVGFIIALLLYTKAIIQVVKKESENGEDVKGFFK